MIGHIRAKKNGVHLFCDSEAGKAVIAAAEERDREEQEKAENKKKKELSAEQRIVDEDGDDN